MSSIWILVSFEIITWTNFTINVLYKYALRRTIQKKYIHIFHKIHVKLLLNHLMKHTYRISISVTISFDKYWQYCTTSGNSLHSLSERHDSNVLQNNGNILYNRNCFSLSVSKSLSCKNSENTFCKCVIAIRVASSLHSRRLLGQSRVSNCWAIAFLK